MSDLSTLSFPSIALFRIDASKIIVNFSFFKVQCCHIFKYY